jgi:hypothetical protein
MMIVKKMKNRNFALLISGALFSTSILVLNIIPLIWFYIPSPIETGNLTFAWFLMPFGIIEGALGAF